MSAPDRAESEHAQLVRAYEALVAATDPVPYQVWTLAEKALNLAGAAQAESERLRDALQAIYVGSGDAKHNPREFSRRALIAEDDEK